MAPVVHAMNRMDVEERQQRPARKNLELARDARNQFGHTALLVVAKRIADQEVEATSTSTATTRTEREEDGFMIGGGRWRFTTGNLPCALT